jgi:hypothetical protein
MVEQRARYAGPWHMWHFLAVLGLSLIGTSAIAAEARQGPDWVLVNPQADWQARDSQGEFVFDNQLWILGGWFAVKQPNPRDVWKSPDGRQWTRTVQQAPWEHGDLSVALVYRNRMWFMGGRKLPGKDNSNAVWSSPDGAQWTLESAHAGWCPRVAPCFAVFKDRMWVFGGSENFYENTDQTLKNDVWSSNDGKAWTLETAQAAWPKRTNAQAVVFDNKLWIMGGGRWAPKTELHNDVWCSADGVHWTLVTAAAPWKPRQWFSLAVYRGQMWVLAGWSRVDGNYGDVWYSKDGKSWTELKSNVIWKKRHEPSVVVFQGKLWLYGGCADKLNSEVWTLELPESWSP